MNKGRYDNIATTLRYDGKQVYLSTYYPEILDSGSDFYMTSVYGDRLDLLSFKFYKDPQYWWVIAQANNLGKGSLAIPSGTQLKIPRLTTVLTNFNSENSS